MDLDGRGSRQNHRRPALRQSRVARSPPSQRCLIAHVDLAASRVLIAPWTWDVSGPELTVRLPAARGHAGPPSGRVTDRLRRIGGSSFHRSGKPSLGHLYENFAFEISLGGSGPAKTFISIREVFVSQRHDTDPKSII